MKIALLGAGRLATNIAPALRHAGHTIAQVYSPTMASARALAAEVGAEAVDSVEHIGRDADIYLLAVKDSALPSLAAAIGRGRDNSIIAHTAGSISIDIFRGHASRYGVVYPMQTFSKERRVDFAEVPCFVEGSDDETLQALRSLAASVSRSVASLSSADRRYLHLAAVFACNFANHCYALAADIAESHGISFSQLLPLIDETARKVHALAPSQAQTGPAVRYDENVINAQRAMLKDNPQALAVYEAMSESIHSFS